MLSDLLNRPVTITTRDPSGSRDDYGNPIDAETTTETVGELQQRQRDESETHLELSDTSWLLVLPAGTEISADSMVTVDGRDYELDGDPWTVRNPRTQQDSHIEATVRRVAGADSP